MDITALSSLICSRHAKIYDVLIEHGKPLTDRQIAAKLRMVDPNKVRPRITELKKFGLLQEVGRVRDRHTGRSVRRLVAVVPVNGLVKPVEALKGRRCPRTLYVVWSQKSKFAGEAFRLKSDAMKELDNVSRSPDTVVLEVRIARVRGRSYPDGAEKSKELMKASLPKSSPLGCK